ncbi:secretin N-terminal domain-containing protein [Lysobacter arvi]|uniref:Secretin N-terminal domain-containing protein n=1 Tax=Lysobacter arvi TaxID=3038776 RepID=A0ABU1CBL1_9GAMM|nr:secretin N-terminal domain-containing protein [Lysobacter arvi]MDR0182583.1 secretin N-terminal domain-containing protein [Lysobacter arvi]
MSRVHAIAMGLAVALLAACATDLKYQQMDSRLDTLAPAEALSWLAKETSRHPDDLVLRSRYLAMQRYLVDDYLSRAMAAYETGDVEQARSWAGKAQTLAPGDDAPRATLEWIDRNAQADSMLRYAQSIHARDPVQALGVLDGLLAKYPNHPRAKRLRDEWSAPDGPLGPQLNADMNKPITVQFREQPLISIFELMSNITGLNFTFDKDVPSTAPTTIYATATPVRQVLSLVLQANQLSSKVVSGNSVLIYPKRPDKDIEYRNLRVRTFYLQYAQAPQVLATLKQMVKTRDAVLDERTNAIIMRDAPEAIEVAERLIAAIDVAPAEVMIEAQVLEVSANDLLQFGIQYPDRVDFSAQPQPDGPDGLVRAPGLLTLEQLKSLNSNDILVRLGPPSIAIDILQSQGRTNTLANPRIRVRNREKAKVLIGDRLPVVTTTLSDNFSTESVNYQDVGLSLDVEPVIGSNNEVQIKLRMEVSSVTDTITTDSGLVAYQIGTRTAETVMSVRNNQTQALAGLLQRTEQGGTTGLPGLSRIPILDRIFGTRNHDKHRTELILLITPRIVRNQSMPASSITAFDSGTEARMGIEPAPTSPSSTSAAGTPASSTPPGGRP